MDTVFDFHSTYIVVEFLFISFKDALKHGNRCTYDIERQKIVVQFLIG